jgi:hypothetical protein
LHRFYQNLLNKILKRGVVSTLLLTFCIPSFSQTAPGLVDSMEKILKSINTEEKSGITINKLPKNFNFTEYELSKDFLQKVITYTPTRFLVLSTKDRCALFDLYLADLLKVNPNKSLNYFVFENKKTKSQIMIKDKNLIEKMIELECPKSIKLAKYFDWPAIKSTSKTINFKSPTDLNQCLKTHKSMTEDIKMVHLCGISENIQNLNQTKEKINRTDKKNYDKLKALRLKVLKYSKIKDFFNDSALNYLNQACNYLDSSLNFCQSFFSTNYWSKITKSEKHISPMRSFCPKLIKDDKPSQSKLRNCLTKLQKEPSQCHYQEEISSLSPMPRCHEISEALNNSRFSHDYKDCPSDIYNEGIVNLSRLYSYFAGIQNTNRHCAGLHSANFIEYNAPIAQDRNWKGQTCFQNKILDREECYPTSFAEDKKSKYSLTRSVAKVLEKTRGTDINLKCEVITEKEYKPSLLKFKAGCYVILNNECHQGDCDPKVLLNQVEMKQVYFKSGVFLDYDAGDVKEEKLAQINLLKEAKGIKSKKIINLTLLKTFFKEHPKGLVHGVGCAHELYPEHFKVYHLSDCKPLSFIISGYIEEKGLSSMILLSGADHSNAPRIIPWSRIVNALNTYQLRHPLNLWSFYGSY